jgi:PAS domain S-box-containing protein
MLELEYRFHRADGQSILCLCRDTVFERNPEGAVAQILGTVVDITERNQAELTLRDAEQRLRHFLQAVPIGVIRWRKDGAVLDANAHFLEMVGYTWEDLHRGRVRWDAMTPPEWQERTAEATAELQATGRVYPFDAAYRRKDGTVVPVLFSAVVVDPRAGEGTAFVLDLTDQKRAEAELRRALAAKEAALADNVTLLREVHHRTKNNLQMLCDLLYLQAATLSSQEAKTVLEEAYGRIFAIARLHEQLYQSLGSGQIILGEYLGRLIAGFRSVYPQTLFILEAPGDLALDVDCAIHLGLVVNELVTNALKYAFPDGRRAEVRVGLRREGALLVLEVRDNGVGLPANVDLEHAKTLGLRIVRILADRLRASVKIENEGGAAFTLAFPVAAPESPA